ncbi:MAG: NAD-dependent dehydratase [Betaproteobacteria bacterium]|nr:NAD-dependent dehydratase [Betaproteobacteria bacterium]
METDRGRVCVVGGGSQIARFLIPRLVERGNAVTVISSVARASTRSVRWIHGVQAPLDRLLVGECPIDTLVWLPPLDVLPGVLDHLQAAGVRRLVAFSTTARFYKASSRDARERDFARRITEAEERLADAGTRDGIVWTLFRPTLVYGCGQDENVARVARMIRKLGFFPLVGGARGLRQPVHADDLALATIEAIDREATHFRDYDLSGGTTLRYREMVSRVFEALDRTPRFLPVSGALLRSMIPLLAIAPAFRSVSPEAVTRMGEDLCFSHEPATRDFGYAPGGFRLDPEALGFGAVPGDVADRGRPRSG